MKKEIFNYLIGIGKKISISDYEAEIEGLREEDRILHELYGSCQYDLCSQIHNGESLLCEVADITIFARKRRIRSPNRAIEKYYS
ncbi:MAG: hypothetical protein AAB781_00970 [Patescibacteria group bacterium]